MVTVEDLDMRQRIVESEIAGEKLVTRHVLLQAQHNADDLADIKTQLRHFRDDMALVKAAQIAQGGTLNILVQDVAALRNDATELRRGQEAINARLDRMQDEMNARFDRMQDEMNVRFVRMQDATNARFVQLEARFDRMQDETNARFAQMEARFDRLEQNVAAILAAVSPRGPA